MWKQGRIRFPIFRTCIAICTDGSCNSIFKNTDSFFDICPYELTTFLDDMDDIEIPVALTSDDTVGSWNEEIHHGTNNTMDDSESDTSGLLVAQHYNQLEDKFIQKYFQKANIQNVTFKE